MSCVNKIYETPEGTMVEIQLKNVFLKGELTLVQHGPGPNPDLDIIQLANVQELPSLKQINGPVSFPVKEVISFDVFSIFKKPRGYDPNPPADSPISQSSKGSKAPKKKAAPSSKKAKRAEAIKELQPSEIILRTYVIKEEPKLKQLMKLLKEVEVCGLSFEGQNVGRHGVVAWLILTAGKTLIPIDMDTLSEKMPNLWKVLEKDLFSNEKLVKIMHDARPAADYLQHAHGIQMANVFDTQVAEALISFNQQNSSPSQFNALSDCLSLNNKRIPNEEIEFLRKFEAQDFSTNSPMLKKPLPPPDCLKLCALKVKHLVPLRENLIKRMMEKFDLCVEAHMNSYRNLTRDQYSSMVKDTRHVSEDVLEALEEDLGQLII